MRLKVAVPRPRNGGAFRCAARYILDMARWRPDPDDPSCHSATIHPADGLLPDGQGIHVLRWQ